MELFGGHFPAIFFFGLDDDGLCTGEAHHFGVGEPERGWDDHFVTGLAGGEDGIVAGVLGPVGDDDLGGFVIEAVVGLEFVGDGLTEFGDPAGRGVFGEPSVERGHCGGFDMFWRVVIGFTGSEAANVDALGLHGFGFGVDGEGEGRGEDCGAVGEFHGVIGLVGDVMSRSCAFGGETRRLF